MRRSETLTDDRILEQFMLSKEGGGGQGTCHLQIQINKTRGTNGLPPCEHEVSSLR